MVSKGFILLIGLSLATFLLLINDVAARDLAETSFPDGESKYSSHR